MRFPKPILAVVAACAVTAVSAAAADNATPPAEKAAPTKATANELTVDLKVKGMT